MLAVKVEHLARLGKLLWQLSFGGEQRVEWRCPAQEAVDL
jgi:hypothetical protein